MLISSRFRVRLWCFRKSRFEIGLGVFFDLGFLSWFDFFLHFRIGSLLLSSGLEVLDWVHNRFRVLVLDFKFFLYESSRFVFFFIFASVVCS